jgi:O-antigen/teichoic acid export membrane protein
MSGGLTLKNTPPIESPASTPSSTLSKYLKLWRSKLSSQAIDDGFWTLLGNIATLAVSLGIVKITTNIVGAAEYGKASLVLGVLAVITSFVSGPLFVAHLRMYFDWLQAGKVTEYIKAFRWILFACGLVMCGIYALVTFSAMRLGSLVYYDLLIESCLLILAQLYWSASANYLEAQRQYRKVAFSNVAQKLGVLATLPFLLHSAPSASSALIIASIVPLLLLMLAFGHIPSGAQKDELTPPLRQVLSDIKVSLWQFGFALPIGYVANWALSTSDRYVIEYFRSTEEVGIYAMNYGFWSLPFVVLNGWLEVLFRSRLYGRAAAQDVKGMKEVLAWRLGVGATVSLCGLGLLVLVGERLGLLMLGDYWAGKKLMVAIAAAHVAFVAGYGAASLFVAVKRFRILTFTTTAAAVFNLGLNFAIVPRFGVMGAAASTLLAYMLWFFMLLAAIRWRGRHLF